jgi:hypothetical protein
MPIQGTFSIKKVLSVGIDSPIVGLDGNASTKQIFSTETPNGGVSPVYVRSTTCWAKNIDLSPASPWHSLNGTNVYGGTLISPRHVIMSSHACPTIGNTLIFVDMNNNCYTRTISNSQRVTTSETTDIQIGLLDSDLPSSISFCKIANFNLASLGSYSDTIPVIWLDKENKALIGEYFYSGYSDFNDGLVFPQYMGAVRYSDNSQRYKFWEGIVDSGKPAGFVFNNKIILLLTFSISDMTTIAYGGSQAYYINGINSVMTSLGGGYTLSLFTENDLKGNNKIQNPSVSYLEPLYINNQSTEIYNPNNTYIFQGGSVNTISTVFNIQNFTGGGTFSTADLLYINNVLYYRKTGAGAGWKTAAGADATNTVINVGEVIYLRYYNNLAGGRSVNSGAIIQRQNYGKFSIR